jgi:oligoribonuclease (3'-5' exoribonuclease)
MSTNNSDIAERIAAARHEAESLKEKIKQKKDALADTTRKFFSYVCSWFSSMQILGASVIVGKAKVLGGLANLLSCLYQTINVSSVAN